MASRMQRRLQQRQREKERRFEEKYEKEIAERQNRIDDRVLELYSVCMGLAIHDEYGYMPTRINRIVTAFCRRMKQYADTDITYEELAKELEQKTGVVFVWEK